MHVLLPRAQPARRQPVKTPSWSRPCAPEAFWRRDGWISLDLLPERLISRALGRRLAPATPSLVEDDQTPQGEGRIEGAGTLLPASPNASDSDDLCDIGNWRWREPSSRRALAASGRYVGYVRTFTRRSAAGNRLVAVPRRRHEACPVLAAPAAFPGVARAMNATAGGDGHCSVSRRHIPATLATPQPSPGEERQRGLTSDSSASGETIVSS